MMATGMRSLDISVFFYGNMFKQVIMPCNRYLIINFLNFLVRYGLTSTSHLLIDFPDGSLDVPCDYFLRRCVDGLVKKI